ncbi:MAG: esterase [Bacteroidetes bacterium]|nr:MAG: esterase [Bacteroidota bacterium]
MKREIRWWYSPSLQKDMEVAVYGHYGFALLLFPTAGADYLEYERFNLIEMIRPYIEAGKVKVYSINSINKESWLNRNMSGYSKAIRHQQFNNYITEEIVPFIHMDCQGLVPIVTAGASLGAFHAANSLFRRPDIFSGTIAMSGSYDLKDYTSGYFDENVFFNSPVDYLYHMHYDDYSARLLRRHNNRIIIATGQGNYEKPSATGDISNLLSAKNIPHWADWWGYDMPHDWDTWRKMLPYFLGTLVQNPPY